MSDEYEKYFRSTMQTSHAQTKVSHEAKVSVKTTEVHKFPFPKTRSNSAIPSDAITNAFFPKAKNVTQYVKSKWYYPPFWEHQIIILSWRQAR